MLPGCSSLPGPSDERDAVWAVSALRRRRPALRVAVVPAGRARLREQFLGVESGALRFHGGLGPGQRSGRSAVFIADASTLNRVTEGTLPLTDDFPKRLSDARVPALREPGLIALGLDSGEARKRFARSKFNL